MWRTQRLNQTFSTGLCIALCIRSNTTYIIHLVILLQVDPSMKSSLKLMWVCLKMWIVGMNRMWLSSSRVQTRWQVCFLQIRVVDITNLSTYLNTMCLSYMHTYYKCKPIAMPKIWTQLSGRIASLFCAMLKCKLLLLLLLLNIINKK